MWKTLVVIIMGVFLMAADPATNGDSVKHERARLEGRWLLNSFEAGGERIAEFKDVQTWHFTADTLTRYEGSRKMELARCEIQPGTKPKQLDFVPLEGGEGDERERFVARTKCLYSLEGDELKIALTAMFLPGTPEEEKRRAIEYANTRPKSFDTKKGDVVVLILKRENKIPK